MASATPTLAQTASAAGLSPAPAPAASKRPRLEQPTAIDWPAITSRFPFPPKRYQILTTEALARGKDVMLIAPTGSGKGYILNNLLEAFPSKCFIVLEPLQMLQEEMCKRMGEKAVYINARNKTHELLTKVKDGKYRMVFLSIEMALGNAFRAVLRDSTFQSTLGAIILDEAQVLKEWAVDSPFRKAMRDVSVLRHLAQIPGVAMSGTLPESYRKVVRSLFELNEEEVIDLGVDRPNIELVVAPIKHTVSSFHDIFAWLPELHGDSPNTEEAREEVRRKCIPTILYINNKSQQFELFHALRRWYGRMGLADSVLIVSADYSALHRAQIPELVVGGKILCVVSTSVLGMGSDLRPILRVGHWRITAQDTLPGVIQQTGRAGRGPETKALGIVWVDKWAVPGAVLEMIESGGQLPTEPLAEGEEEGARSVRPETSRLRAAADPQLMEVITHAFSGRGCIRTLVNKLLGQPAADKLPPVEDIYGSMQKDLPCCSFCEGRALPDLPSRFTVENDDEGTRSRTTRDGITKLQEHVEERLRQWRIEKWKTDWKLRNAPKSLDPAYFMRVEDVASVVKHLGKIDRAFSADNDEVLDKYVSMQAKTVVLPQLRDWLKETIAAYDTARDRERQQRVDKQRLEKMRQRLQTQAQRNVQRAESSGTTSYSCSACVDWNTRHPDQEQLDSKGHTKKNKNCPVKKLPSGSTSTSTSAQS